MAEDLGEPNADEGDKDPLAHLQVHLADIVCKG